MSTINTELTPMENAGFLALQDFDFASAIFEEMEGLNATVDTTGTSADSTTSDQVDTTAAATDATSATSAVTTAVTTAGSGSPNTGFDNTVGIAAAAVILLLSVTAAVAVIRKRSGAR